jgi:hypothetical protein
LNFNDLSSTKEIGRKNLSSVWGNICANDSPEYRRADTGTRVRTQDGHDHRSIFRFAFGGRGPDGLRLEPLNSAAVRSAIYLPLAPIARALIR